MYMTVILNTSYANSAFEYHERYLKTLNAPNENATVYCFFCLLFIRFFFVLNYFFHNVYNFVYSTK